MATLPLKATLAQRSEDISTPIISRVLDSVKEPFGIGNSLDLLWIRTYVEGTNKPFIYYGSTTVVTGICRVF